MFRVCTLPLVLLTLLEGCTPDFHPPGDDPFLVVTQFPQRRYDIESEYALGIIVAMWPDGTTIRAESRAVVGSRYLIGRLPPASAACLMHDIFINEVYNDIPNELALDFVGDRYLFRGDEVITRYVPWNLADNSILLKRLLALELEDQVLFEGYPQLEHEWLQDYMATGNGGNAEHARQVP